MKKETKEKIRKRIQENEIFLNVRWGGDTDREWIENEIEFLQNLLNEE